jgi:ABC-2 type transport system ATP-binding protein
VSFLYRGRVNAITKILAETDLVDFMVEEPDLEEIFLHYYQKGDEQ